MREMMFLEPPADAAQSIAREVGRVRPAAHVVAHHFRLDLSDACDAAIAAHLHPEDADRAERFSRSDDRRRVRRARAALRAVLAGYTGLPADEVRLARADDGKPYLAADHGRAVRFNMSWSGEDAVIAVARGVEVGVDVEPLSRPVDVARLEAFALTPAERAWINRLDAPDRTGAFLKLWTFKEAVLKASGVGLRRPACAVATSHALRNGETDRDVLTLDGAAFTTVDISRDGRVAAVAYPAA